MSIAPFPKLESDERHRVPAPRFIVTGHPTLNEASLERASGWEFRIIPRERARSSERYCGTGTGPNERALEFGIIHSPKSEERHESFRAKLAKGSEMPGNEPHPGFAVRHVRFHLVFCGLAMLPAAGQIKHRWPIDEDYFFYGEVLDILSRPHRHRVGREERAVGRDGDTIFGAPSTASRRASAGGVPSGAKCDNLGLPSPTTRRALGGTERRQAGAGALFIVNFLNIFRTLVTTSGIKREGPAVRRAMARCARSHSIIIYDFLGILFVKFLLDTFGIASGSGDV
ncbi:hypothetical protein B0H10DRAFT_2199985 [Mycena sp. CBHHK59/15]|nr:hypothetical protein B0H10DRAFT_2199985 [Mycena sp. CBHHK59/15]